MEINHYRLPNHQGLKEAWDACQFTSKTDLSPFTVKPLVTINGRHFIRQHHVTYLTGKETCRAHHFAKLLATNLLSPSCHVCSDGNPVTSCPVGGGSAAVQSSSPSSPSTGCKVLWIDTIHGPHICTAIYNELAAHATAGDDLHFVCLDILGAQRDNFYALNMGIEDLISKLKPALVVIDDIDHFMPYCGVKQATDFCRLVRDTTNHSETAFLFIGYNHLGKKASTTGNLGKYLFIDASDVFALSTQRDITTVRLANSYDMRCVSSDAEFRFTIGSDNLPHEIDAVPKASRQPIDDDTLCNIVNDILEPGKPVTPDELLRQVTARHRELLQQGRTTKLLNQALRLNLLRPHPNGGYAPVSTSPVYGGTATVESSPEETHNLESPSSPSSESTPSSEINIQLTLPPLPQPSPMAAGHPCRD